MSGSRLVSPSGAVIADTSQSGDEVQFHLTVDTSSGMTAVHEALVALGMFTDAIRDQFGVPS